MVFPFIFSKGLQSSFPFRGHFDPFTIRRGVTGLGWFGRVLGLTRGGTILLNNHLTGPRDRHDGAMPKLMRHIPTKSAYFMESLIV